MADWKTARFDPDYPEKIDPEILPLCDALNDAGIETTQSCCGHGWRWPCVWFKHSTDERIEDLARFVLRREHGDYRPHFTVFQKEIELDGCRWSLEIHLNDVYSHTPVDSAMMKAVLAIAEVTALVEAWRLNMSTT